jgi:hypothetical protein
MNREELRIGNLIKHPQSDSKYVIVKGIHTPIYYETPTEMIDSDIFQNFKPIPLTEEWLQRFGFENYGYDLLCWRLGDVELVGLYTDFAWNFINTPNDKHVQVGVLHVHQLQNLYFSLTGSELELKSLHH